MKKISLILAIGVVSIVLAPLVGSFPNTAIATTDDSHLVGCWHLDKGSGTTAHDSSGNGNHGTLKNGPTWVDGKFGRALKFNGGYIEVPATLLLNKITGEVSVSAWIKHTATEKAQKIFSTQDGNAGGSKLGVYDNDKVEFEIRDSSNNPHLNRDVTGGTVLKTDVWYHVVGIYNDSANWLATYVNGKLDREMTARGVLAETTNISTIGREAYLEGYCWSGIIDEVRVYNRALSEEKILDLYETPTPTPSPTPTPTPTPSPKTVTFVPSKIIVFCTTIHK